MKRIIDLETLHLSEGAHQDPEQGMCIMEAAAYIAGEPFSDHPQCVSPVLAAFCRAWNDTPAPYGQAIRDRLRHYIPRLIGTAGDAAREERRSWMALDWLIRVHEATWLRRAGLTEHADALMHLPPQTSTDALASSRAAWAAAWAAARAAARAAAGAAAGDAAWDAAWAAAWAAAGAAGAAGAAAGAAAWAAAGDAAWDAAWAAAGAAGAAAGAAWDAILKSTIEELQASAWQLLDALIVCE